MNIQVFVPVQPDIANDPLVFLPWKNDNMPRLYDDFAFLSLLCTIYHSVVIRKKF